MLLVYDITQTVLYYELVNIACPHCGCQKCELRVQENKASTLFGLFSHASNKSICVCPECGKTVRKKYWSRDLKVYAKQKLREVRAPFYVRWRGMLIVFLLFLSVFVYHSFNNWVRKQNFATTYGFEEKAKWYEKLEEGDFLLCNKNYLDPVQVYQFIRFEGNDVIFKVYDQTFAYGDYQKGNQLDKLPLGNAKVIREVRVKKSSLIKNSQIVEVSDTSLIPGLNVQQIKKNK